MATGAGARLARRRPASPRPTAGTGAEPPRAAGWVSG